MNTGFSAFDDVHHSGENATHPLARRLVRLPLSLLLAGPDPLRRRFAASTRSDAPSGASNCGFQV
jgi:hypothetical protein